MRPKTKRRTGGGTMLICAREVGEMIGLDEVTVHRWNAAGKLPAPTLKRPGCTRWSRADLEWWIELGCPGRREFEARRAARR